ncbi:MAG TPA: apolipoprotein N-acyltransferase [Chitinophagaceae bacterium]|nr:apolipoprotein N-acyltransferase [Chitinophagaceae bacterium]
MKRFTPLLLSLTGGLLLWAAWPVSPLTLLIFVAWIPLLWIESTVQSRKKFFSLTYLAMFTWNIATTWWIWNASPPGAAAAFIANSLLMCFPWLGFRIAKKWLGENGGYTALIVFWMSFEYLHLQDWGLSWPWLSLGNALATHPEWIQWYEYSGTSGGTLWILLVNILLFRHLKWNYSRQGVKSYKYMIGAVLTLLLPLGISLLIKPSATNRNATTNIVIVQPNIDPYEKVSTGSFDNQLQTLLSLSEKQVDANTALLIWPETALYMSHGIEEDSMRKNYFLNPLWGFMQRNPRLDLFTGIESYRVYNNRQTKTARPMGESGYFYDAYNGSVLLDSAGPRGFYHKSMLVPGVETLPWFLKFIDSWFEKFGGTTAGYAKQKDRTVLKTRQEYKIAPSICYESIYGEFMARYIRNGANLICIVTNDGWWDNTPGHKQHMSYARLRAIETRTWVARSANTGISCFIDPAGNLISPQPWDKAAAIKLNVPVTEVKTFYVSMGDLLSKLAIIATLFLITWALVLKIKNRSIARK